jgi:hypothetical protein
VEKGRTLLPPLFHATDVEEVLERFEPELIVIGTGYPGMMNV